MNWHIFIGILVGLAIFIHGIENFSREVLSFAGEKFRKMMKYATRNRVIASLVGMFVTGIIQSSTATTVITISLVSAGVISFAQSLGVIFGANVGTTLTAQLVAFKITSYAPFLIIIGFFTGIFGRHYKYIGRGIFYFGLVLYGLNLVSEAISPIKDDPRILELFSNLSNAYLAILIGILLTALAHSSSITTGLVVILAGSGIISLEQGIPILLGSNIGTTITSINASTKLSLHARRGAAAHVFFNITGVILLLPLMTPFIHLIQNIGGTSAQQIANAHTIFNLATVILFLIILKPVQRLITKIVKGEEEEVLIGTKYLNNGLPGNNRSAFSLIEKEISYTLEIAVGFYELAIRSITEKKEVRQGLVDKYETLVDLLDNAIEKALLELSKRALKEKEAKKTVMLIRISNLSEQLADIAKNLTRLPQSHSISLASLSDEALKGIEKIYLKINEPLLILKREFPRPIPDYSKHIRHLNAVEPTIIRGYGEHIKRMQKREAQGGSIFVESSSLLGDGTEKLKEMIKLCQRYSKLK
jgi:phosphate:Na+ symporter